MAKAIKKNQKPASPRVASKVKAAEVSEVKYSGMHAFRKAFAVVAVFAWVVSLASPYAVYGAKPGSDPAAYNLDQCANGGVGDPIVQCAGSAWQNGNLNANQAHYVEGQFVPYRMQVTDLVDGAHTVDIEYDTVRSDKHSIDYIGSFNSNETDANPCIASIVGCNPAAPTSSFAVPAASMTFSNAALNTFTGVQAAGSVKMWNGTLTGVSYVSQNVLSGSSNYTTTVRFTFTTSGVTTAVIAWGGHIGSRLDWGSGNSAGNINGSSYHMRNGGQDRSLSADAVLPPGNLTVIKHVINDNGGTKVDSDFTINISGVNASVSSVVGSESGTPVSIDAGAYSVTEPSDVGYTTTYSAGCSGTIASAQTVTCTVTNNDKPANLTVIKEVTNNNGGTKVPSDFTINVTGGSVSNPSFAGSGTGTTVTLNAGAYSVGETADAGYSPSYSANCSGSIANGETKVCTVTNDDIQPTLKVVKVVDNADNETILTVSDFAPYKVGDVEVTEGVATSFDAGVYVVTETNKDNYVASYSGACDLQGTVTLNVGDNKTCTITNTYNKPAPNRVTIMVIKHVINDDGTKSNVAADFTIEGTGTNISDNSFAGSEEGVSIQVDENTAFSFDEVDSLGYTKTLSADCSSETGITVEQSPVTCTITNDDPDATDISVNKTVDDSTVINGTNVTFTVTVTNNGPKDATGVSVTDLLPAGLTYVSADPDADYDEVTGVWTIGDLAVDASAVLTIVATASGEPQTVLTNEACAVSGLVDLNLENNCNSATVTIITRATPTADLGITKTVDQSTVANGDEVTFTVTVTNNDGEQGDTATEVVVNDLLPSNFEFVSADSEDYDEESGVWTIGSLPGGSSAVLHITVKVNGADTNHACVTSSGATVDSNSENDCADSSVTVRTSGGGGGGSSGGGGGGGCVFNCPGSTPQVLGDTTPTPPAPSLPVPQVLGETTTLPRTGTGANTLALLVLASLPLMFIKKPQVN